MFSCFEREMLPCFHFSLLSFVFCLVSHACALRIRAPFLLSRTQALLLHFCCQAQHGDEEERERERERWKKKKEEHVLNNTSVAGAGGIEVGYTPRLLLRWCTKDGRRAGGHTRPDQKQKKKARQEKIRAQRRKARLKKNTRREKDKRDKRSKRTKTRGKPTYYISSPDSAA
jgi:hypothetical protein